jgi:2-dehydropantoate 2-reductase
MRIAVLGGAGAMGAVFGGRLAQAGHDVTLLDVSPEAVDTINRLGLTIEGKTGERELISLRASTDPAAAAGCELLLVFVKCYHTEAAVRSVASHLTGGATILSRQNGWGNAPLIAGIVGEERTMIGVSYHSASVLEPGRVKHTGQGVTFIGELNSAMSERLRHIAETFRAAGFDVIPTQTVLKEIWSKLALNACTLPTSALLRFYAGQLVEHDSMLSLMREILREVVAVVSALGVEIDEEERWDSITGLLKRAANAKSSMLQDVEKQRRTEIDVINGAVVAAGQRLGIQTPYNQSMVWLVKSLEENAERFRN